MSAIEIAEDCFFENLGKQGICLTILRAATGGHISKDKIKEIIAWLTENDLINEKTSVLQKT